MIETIQKPVLIADNAFGTAQLRVQKMKSNGEWLVIVYSNSGELLDAEVIKKRTLDDKFYPDLDSLVVSKEFKDFCRTWAVVVTIGSTQHIQ